MKRNYEEDLNDSSSTTTYTNNNIEEEYNEIIVELTFALEAILMEVVPSRLKGLSITDLVAFATKYVSHLPNSIWKTFSVDDLMGGYLFEYQDKIQNKLSKQNCNIIKLYQ